VDAVWIFASGRGLGAADRTDRRLTRPPVGIAAGRISDGHGRAHLTSANADHAVRPALAGHEVLQCRHHPITHPVIIGGGPWCRYRGDELMGYA
jgi:hypothetical protein